MSIGQLSADQQRFAELVAAGTGLHAAVVASWVGAESGWGVSKPSHNYLNVRNVTGGGFANYESTDQAAARVAGLIRNSRYYGGIRGAIPRGPGAQVDAIVASPWDAGHYQRGDSNLLTTTYQRVAAMFTGAAGALADIELPGGIKVPTPGPTIDLDPDIGHFLGKGAELLGLDKLGRQVLVAGLGLVFTIAAFGIIALGLQRLTGYGPRDAFEDVTKAAGTVGAVAAI